jgi:alkylhydroperoxidase family enzyme
MRSVYEWTNHYFVGRGVGLSDEDARGVRDWGRHAGFGERERAVLGLVDEALERDAIGYEALERCLALFGVGPLLELALLPGLYRAVAVLLASLEVPLEPGRPPWAPDGVAP